MSTETTETDDVKAKRMQRRARSLRPLRDKFRKVFDDIGASKIPPSVTSDIRDLGVTPENDGLLAGPFMMLSFAAQRIKMVCGGDINEAIGVLSDVMERKDNLYWFAPDDGDLDGEDGAVFRQAARIMRSSVREIIVVLGDEHERCYDLCCYMIHLWNTTSKDP